MGNLLTTTQWARIMGYNPFFMYGFAGALLPAQTACNKPVAKYSWQDADNSGRDEIEQAIANAESILAKHLKYRVAPQYGEQTLKYPAFPEWATYRANWPPEQPLDEGYIQSLGIESLSLAFAASPVTYSDKDGDGLQDTFTVTIATALTDPLAFRLYFAAADRYDGSGVGETWAIRPIKCTIAAGTATITGPKWILGKPILYEKFNWNNNGLDPSDASNFVTTVDIYTSTTNTGGTTNDTAEALLTWETAPWPWACCGPVPSNSLTNDPAALAYGFARGNVRNSQQGWVYAALAVYNATTGIWNSSWWTSCRAPDRITIRYLAGYPLNTNSYSADYGQIDRALQVVIARLAAAELTRPPLACETAGNRELAKWQMDLSQVRGRADELYATTREILNNPIGTSRGHLQAWRYIENNMNVHGVAIS